jgi:hypothetical protein
VREVPLQVDLPSSGSILDAPATEAAAEKATPTAKPRAESDEEFSVTPQARPERVAPVPKPSPTPTPRPL